MAADIVPELYERIQREFKKNMAGSSLIKDFQSKGDQATEKEVSLYAAELGKCVSGALASVLTEDALPNGTLYWNIAQRTIVPLLEEVYTLVMEAAETAQRQQDKKIGIHINPVRPEFPKERIDGLINKLMEYQEDEDGEQI